MCILIKYKTKQQTPMTQTTGNNRAYSCKGDIADQFYNTHFVDVGPSLANEIENCDDSP